MPNKLKIVVAHPGKQHSYRLASALKKEELLDKYITTIYVKDSSTVLKMISKLLGNNNSKRLSSRRNKDLNDNDVIQYYIWRGLIETLLYRVDKKHKIYEIYRYRTSKKFGKKVANYAIKNKVDAVIMYDSNANYCFEILKNKAPQIKRILDVSIAARPYLKSIYERDIEITGDRKIVQENYEVFGKNAIERSTQEINLTQSFIVASDFVAQSLISLGVDNEQIFKVPYGINLNTGYSSHAIDNRLIFIFVGQVISRKGVHHLLKAFSKVSSIKLELWLVGTIDKSSTLYKEYNHYDNIHFWGMVNQHELIELYKRANVFIMPSLGEGMTLAGLEAMGCGLPVICTINTGLTDVVEHRKNGYYIPVSNEVAIREAIEWFNEHNQKIDEMGRLAAEKVQSFTWCIYENNVVNAVNSILKR